MLAARDLSASHHPTAYSKPNCGWHGVRLATASSSQGLEPPCKAAPPHQGVLHCSPNGNIFPTVQSEPPHPELVTVTSDHLLVLGRAWLCHLHSSEFLCGWWGLSGEQWYIAIGLREPPHEHQSTGPQWWPTLLTTTAQTCFARLEPTAEAKASL